jgi:TonB-linked SusC/RagA family outer membrane protein
MWNFTTLSRSGGRQAFPAKLLPLTVLIFLPFLLLAQSARTVSGQIVDADDGMSLPGVTIMVENSISGTITDVDGNFTLEIPSPQTVLIISYIGMEEQRITVGNQQNLAISMAPANNVLDEIIVVGYGSQKRVNLSGAVDNIQTEQLESRPISNLSQGLQGLVPNFNIINASGEPGGAASFNIRGFTSINGGSPLFVVDGIAYDAADLNFLNPNDIASISVLKDASSAAIYGARGAFGVVLITTKTGKENKISYTSFLSSARPTVLPDPITDPYVYMRLSDVATANTPWNYITWSDDQYRWGRERSDDPSLPQVRLDPANPNAYQYLGDNNWNDYFFADNSFSQSHNIAFSGAQGTKMDYFVSGNYSDETGLNKLSKDNFTRYALRSKIGFTPRPWLRFENNSNIYQADRDRPTYSLPNVYNLTPVDVAENPDGSWANTSAGRAAARIVEGGRSEGTELGFQTINRLTATLFDGLLTLTGDATFRRSFNRVHTDGRQYQIGFGPDDLRTEGGETFAAEQRVTEQYNAYNLYATARKTFGKHQVNIVVGYNQEAYEYDLTNSRREGLIVSGLPYIGVASGEQTVSAGFSNWAVRGLFGRVNYIFNDRYILEVNGRYDGTSRFPEDNRWGFFPSVSAAWILSEESFMQPLRGTVSTLKLRASYGSLGNQAVGPYDYILNLPSGTTNNLINGNFQRYIGAPGLTVDPTNYSWEEVTTANVGVEAGLFKDRLFTSFDYYVRNTNGMLAPGAELPSVLGTPEPRANVADLETKGWELAIELRNRFRVGGSPLNLNVRLNLGDSRSTITRYPNEEGLFSGAYYPGQEIGEIWGLESDGFFNSEEEINALNQTGIIPWGAISIVEGWPRFIDQDGNGIIEKGISINDTKDYKKLGNTQPRYNYGIDISLDWKGFDLRTFFQGIGKRDYYPTHYLFWGLYQQPYANTYDHLLNFYRAEGDSEAARANHSQSYLNLGLADANTENVDYPTLQAWLADYRVANGLAIPQSRYLLSGAYLRLKNLTLGYSLPTSLTDKLNIGRLRFYASGENLWESSDLKDFVDPEAIGSGTLDGGQFGGYAYPFQRRYSVGINLDF